VARGRVTVSQRTTVARVTPITGDSLVARGRVPRGGLVARGRVTVAHRATVTRVTSITRGSLVTGDSLVARG